MTAASTACLRSPGWAGRLINGLIIPFDCTNSRETHQNQPSPTSYNDFVNLRNSLVRTVQETEAIPFPSRVWTLGRLSDEKLSQRREGLEKWLRAVVTYDVVVSDGELEMEDTGSRWKLFGRE